MIQMLTKAAGRMKEKSRGGDRFINIKRGVNIFIYTLGGGAEGTVLPSLPPPINKVLRDTMIQKMVE